MEEINFSKLNWPRGLNLDLLSLLEKFVPEDLFKKFIVGFSRELRKNRRIIFPSQRTIKKVYFHYLWTLIEKKETTWEEIKEKFKKDFKTLKALDITKFEAERLYKQREREIRNGK